MKINTYIENEGLLAGMTMKDKAEPENGNMALHACESADHVRSNRQQLAGFLGCSPADFVFANQTHSANFHRVTEGDRGRGADDRETAIPETDALYTFDSGIVLCTLTADCVPVIFYSDENSLTGVIHSGWQGTVKEITLKLFRHLQLEEQCDPRRIHVQIGAALSQEKFEVDEDVYIKFHDLGYADEFIEYNATTNKYHIDNQLTVQKQCELAGIPAENITIDRTCTFQSAEGFSYREDRKAGRHVSFIQRKA
ncbi:MULTISPECIES: polyphenol oxidase family protein [unclassified Sporosarcina]|uniref:polyphenol oxidase family protein n=1 Tax=unclassified Sporosarcina TaxID=2647733 RepID=UPI00203EE8F4|nr:MULTISPECIES: polyphenol oxidase family protein [unclassified Sporosarcina]GKV64028.1 laccase domain protein YlmD [Sporosarcina sp. NCCP-2331]GLB56398.1 laccase domain protein YlmD [Sporosarcina sp. NCCP-2378]